MKEPTRGAQVDPSSLRQRARHARQRAEVLEAEVRGLACELVALSRDVWRASADVGEPEARAMWDAIGWNATTDATDLVSGHLVAATASWPTERRYLKLCERADVAPVKTWAAK